MRLALYTDNTLPLGVDALCALLNSTCTTLSFHAGQVQFRLTDSVVTSPETYGKLPAPLRTETAQFDLTFLCTTVPYDNNFFFEPAGKRVIISFSGWNLLTDLTVANGVVYFVASILADLQGVGKTHENNTGCLNDFWWDKRGVDVGMRAAFLCRECLDSYRGDPAFLEDLNRLLNLVSSASRQGRDVVTFGPQPAPASLFHVFLCHNSEDKADVRVINASLKNAGVRTWLDEEQLPLGTPWQPELEKQIKNVRSACVFVGSSCLGPWQNAEIRAFLSEFVSRGCPVIPVILPSANKIPELPLFLQQMTWIDLRRNPEINLARLAAELRRGRP